MTQQFVGIYPPVVTPFTAEGDIDFPSLDKVVDHLIDGGMHGLFVLGSTGEVAYLTDDQRESVVSAIAARADGRVPMLVGCMEQTSGNDVEFRRLIALNRAAGSPLKLFTGHEMINEAMMLVGADGMVPGFANVDPARYRALWDACVDGKWEHAVAIQEEINAEFDIVFKPRGRGGDGTGVGAFKIAMHLLGVIDTPTQPRPLADFTAEDIAGVREVLVRTGLLS